MPPLSRRLFLAGSAALGASPALARRAALDGMTAQMGAAGVDLGALTDAPAEEFDGIDAEEPAAEQTADA